MRRGVNIVITNHQGKILVLKRSQKEKSFPGLWDLPGGKAKDNETLYEAAEREAEEESRLNIKLEQNYFYVHRCQDRELDICGFKAKLINGNIIMSEEHTEFKWILKDEWRKLEYTPSVKATLKEFFK